MPEMLWILIPLLPLLGAAINMFFGERLPRTTSAWLASAMVGLSAALTLWGLISMRAMPEEERSLLIPLWSWMTTGTFNVDFGFLIDQLSVMMMMIITGVGFFIHMYSIGYMGHDSDIRRYFVYLNLFVFSMLVLVMGSNYLVLFIGWELVGLCSFLLIGFWYKDAGNPLAGQKAFVVNRIGDFAVLLAIFLIFIHFGSLAFRDVFALVPELHNPAALMLITMLLFIGCTGKSAQIPLFVWLPDAMAGPTPVSALIHAATMVTAGVYLIARSSIMFDEIRGPGLDTADVVTWIGVLTAFFAATIALTQTDIKKVLAYSTVSQLGFMFIGVGSGAYVAGVFHLFTHAFFKGLLFLGAGSVMHAMEHGVEHVHGHSHSHGHDDDEDDAHAIAPAHGSHGAHGATAVAATAHGHGHGSHGGAQVFGDADAHHGTSPPAEATAEQPAHFDVQDMRNMGGLWSRIPATAWTFLIGAAALAGFPGTSGFFSKDEVLAMANHNGYFGVYVLGTITAFLTAFYSFRQFFMVFGGAPRTEEAEHAAESPQVMTIPLIVLAVFAGLGGLIFGIPIEHGIFHTWLEPLFAAVHHGAEGAEAVAEVGPDYAGLAIGAMVALAGIGLAWLVYGRRGVDDMDSISTGATGPLYRGSLNKWYIDEIYETIVVRPFQALARFSANFFDRLVVDGAVNGVGSLMRGLGGVVTRFQTGYTRSYALSMVLGAVAVVLYLFYRTR